MSSYRWEWSLKLCSRLHTAPSVPACCRLNTYYGEWKNGLSVLYFPTRCLSSSLPSLLTRLSMARLVLGEGKGQQRSQLTDILKRFHGWLMGTGSLLWDRGSHWYYSLILILFSCSNIKDASYGTLVTYKRYVISR